MKFFSTYFKLLIAIAVIITNVGFIIPTLITTASYTFVIIGVIDMVCSIPMGVMLGKWVFTK